MSREWTPQLTPLGRGANKDIRQLLRDTERRGGWTGHIDGQLHIRLRHDSTGAVVILPGTGHARGRALANTRAAIRRAERIAA